MGYEFERDDITKIMPLNDPPTCYALISGNVITANEMLGATKKDVKNKGTNTVDAIAEIARAHFSNVRKLKILRAEIEPRGLTLDTYYNNQTKLAPAIIQMIDGALRNNDVGVQLIVAGKGDGGCQLFSITNPGDLNCHDSVGYIAIGSGAPHAVYYLIEHGYKKDLPKEDVLKLLTEAKARSQVAPGVGNETTTVTVD